MGLFNKKGITGKTGQKQNKEDLPAFPEIESPKGLFSQFPEIDLVNSMVNQIKARHMQLVDSTNEDIRNLDLRKEELNQMVAKIEAVANTIEDIYTHLTFERDELTKIIEYHAKNASVKEKLSEKLKSDIATEKARYEKINQPTSKVPGK